MNPFRKRAPQVDAARVVREMRSRFNPVRGLAPDTLARQIEQYEAGTLAPLARTLDALERRDDVWKTSALKLRKSVARCRHEIVVVEGQEDNPQAEEHAQVLRDFYANLRATDALARDRRGGVATFVAQAMLAQRDAWHVHEIVWNPANGRLRAELVAVPLWFFENRTGRLRFLETEGALDGVDLEEGGWFVHTGDGVGVACAVASTYKRLSLADWLGYSERSSVPGLHAKTPAAKGSPEWVDLADAVAAFAQEWALVTNQDVDIEPVDASAKGTLPWPALVERMDRAIAALWRGADLATISGGDGGATGASLQGGEADLIEASACSEFSESVQQQLDAPVIAWHFGAGTEPLAYFQLVPQVDPAVDREIKIDAHLANHGVPVSRADAYARYGRRAPDPKDPDDAPLKAHAAAPAVPGLFNTAASSLPSSEGSAQRGVGSSPDEPLPAEIEALAAALRGDLAPLGAELARALEATDGDWPSALTRLRDRLPEIAATIDPATIAAVEAPLARAIASVLPPDPEEAT